jgi:beta-lactamase family protein
MFSIQGHVSPQFRAVREAFAENFVRRRELGGACCAFVHGEKVIDLWGVIRNKQTREPWEQDTIVVVHSATKGLAAMTLATALEDWLPQIVNRLNPWCSPSTEKGSRWRSVADRGAKAKDGVIVLTPSARRQFACSLLQHLGEVFRPHASIR